MAESSQIRILRIYLVKLKTFFKSKNVLSFLFFLCLSTVFWFVNALGKERETSMSLPIRYTGIPQNILITNDPVSQLTLSVKDEGNNLLSYFSKKTLPLVVELDQTFYEKGKIIITSDELLSKITKHLLPSTVVKTISPDTILIQYEKLSTKTLPVRIDGNIELAKQYTFSEAIRIEPAEITVFAPKYILDTMTCVRTELLKQHNVKDSLTLTAKLEPVKLLRFSTDEVKISIFSEKFTEKTIKVPISFINCPSNLVIRTFPTAVNVKFNVGMSRFNDTENIKVVLDYKDITKESIKQKPKVITTNSYISNIQISPEEVEFVLEEK